LTAYKVCSSFKICSSWEFEKKKKFAARLQLLGAAFSQLVCSLFENLTNEKI
jgi:hypothetical protein